MFGGRWMDVIQQLQTNQQADADELKTPTPPLELADLDRSPKPYWLQSFPEFVIHHSLPVLQLFLTFLVLI